MGLQEMRYIQYPPGWQPTQPVIEFLPGRLPERENVEAIFRLHREGKTVREIARFLNGGRTKRIPQRMRLVERVLTEGISRWDWVDDEVAIQRAVDGDHDVWRNLTWYERHEVLERLSYFTEENPHRLATGIRRSPGQQKRTDNFSDAYVDAEASGSSSINGFVEWAFAVGEEPTRIIQNMSKRRQRRHQRNYEQRRAA